MTKLEIESIRALPNEYVRDGTQVWICNGVPVAVNPELIPIMREGCDWVKVTLDIGSRI